MVTRTLERRRRTARRRHRPSPASERGKPSEFILQVPVPLIVPIVTSRVTPLVRVVRIVPARRRRGPLAPPARGRVLAPILAIPSPPYTRRRSRRRNPSPDLERSRIKRRRRRARARVLRLVSRARPARASPSLRTFARATVSSDRVIVRTHERIVVPRVIAVERVATSAHADRFARAASPPGERPRAGQRARRDGSRAARSGRATRGATSRRIRGLARAVRRGVALCVVVLRCVIATRAKKRGGALKRARQ